MPIFSPGCPPIRAESIIGTRVKVYVPYDKMGLKILLLTSLYVSLARTGITVMPCPQMRHKIKHQNSTQIYHNPPLPKPGHVMPPALPFSLLLVGFLTPLILPIAHKLLLCPSELLLERGPLICREALLLLCVLLLKHAHDA